ncbi:hypothetical protein [Streptomyces collinus]|uniref:hypothetical protein n=1 Tax=Streptomyces collinus TaxID=42684 RepID=UPI00382A15B7
MLKVTSDRFWIILTGLVALDVHVPGRQAATVDAISQGELLGWSRRTPGSSARKRMA